MISNLPQRAIRIHIFIGHLCTGNISTPQKTENKNTEKNGHHDKRIPFKDDHLFLQHLLVSERVQSLQLIIFMAQTHRILDKIPYL